MHSLQTIKSNNAQEHQRLVDKRIESLARNALVSLANHGGSSHSLVAGKDMRGSANFAVSIYKDREKVFDATPTEFDVRDYLTANQDVLDKPQHILGLWCNPADGKVYVDISLYVPGRETALRLGRAHNQLAIFDLGAGETITVERRAMERRISAPESFKGLPRRYITRRKT